MLYEENQVLDCIPSLVTREMNEHLLGCITLDELEATIFQMKKGKFPGLDGSPIDFFQEF